jgi:hypothetical protein
VVVVRWQWSRSSGGGVPRWLADKGHNARLFHFLNFSKKFCRESSPLMARMSHGARLWLSANNCLPAKFSREHFAECMLSANLVLRGKGVVP